MKRITPAIILLFTAMSIFPSCTSRSTFTQFYNEHKRDCRLAVTFPRWAGMAFVPKDEKPVVSDMTRGIKRVRLLYEKDQALMKGQLSSFLETHEYSPYLYVRDDGTNLRLFALEDSDHIHEIIFEAEQEGEVIVLALEGKMPKNHFSRIVKEATDK